MPCDSTTLLRDATFPVVVEGGTYGDALEACDADGCAVRRLDFVVHRPTCGGACPPASPVAVIIIHAGGYVRNDACADCWSMEVADFFASRGALAIAVDYRLRRDDGLAPEGFGDGYANRFGNSWRPSPAAMWAAIRDARAAARHARGALGLDCVLAAGNSAGATSAVAMAALGDEAAYRDVRAPDGADDATLAHLDVSSAVDGAFAFAPTVDGVDVLDDAADVWAAASAPLYVAHNDGDPTNDVANSEYVAATYGGAVEVDILAGDAHAIADAPRALAAGLAFLDARGVVDLRDAAAPGGAEFRRSWNASACAVCGSSSSSGGDGADLAIVVAAAAVFILGVGGAVVAGLAVRRRRRSTCDDPEELAKVIPS